MTVAALLCGAFIWVGTVFLAIRWAMAPLHWPKESFVIPNVVWPEPEIARPPGSLTTGRVPGCLHTDTVPVTIASGDKVAELCRTCGAQIREKGW